MASLFKQTVTRPLPAGAELFTRNGERFAKWTDGKGRKRTARVTGEGDAARVQTESATWYVRLRLANGERADVATGCRDKSAAAGRMAELVAEQEKIRGGIISEREANTAKHGRRSLDDAIEAYRRALEEKQRSARHVAETARYLRRAKDELGWRTLSDMDADRLAAWISTKGFRARVANHFIVAYKSFATWGTKRGFLLKSPFGEIERHDEKADRQHIRRALTAEELNRLIQAAWRRPVQEAMKINRGPNKGMDGADVTKETLDRLRFLGWTRALAYWTAATTGLRWGELRSITLGAVRLDADPPHMILQAKSEKARRGAQIPLQADLAAEMGRYLSERRSRLVGHSGASVVEFPGALDGAALFDVPPSMSKVFHLDCKTAGIPRHDGAGRAIDIHALRHTFGTMLAKAGVSLQVAQRAMRHSTPTLTANVYTHLGLLDVAGAVGKLPCIGGVESTPVADEQVANSVTPTVTPNSDNSCRSGVTEGNITTFKGNSTISDTDRVLTNKDGAWQQGAKKELVSGAGLEPAATGLKVRCSTI